RVTEEKAYGFSQRLGVAGWHEESCHAVLYGLGDTSGTSGHHRFAQRHGVQYSCPKALKVRRKNEDFKALHECQNIPAKASKTDVCGKVQRCCLSLQCRA